MSSLVQQRCLQHPDREAAYRCPICRRHYCRECGVEHDGRMLCASCLKKLASNVPTRPHRWTGLLSLAAPFLGLLIAWLFFFGLGQLLLTL
jgi:hypothetical protein